jgi:drug/metabolite transporter (DMT)-like permease
MGILLGVVAAILLGVSDFCAARASRTVHSLTVTRTALGVSGLLMLVLVAFVSSTWTTRDTMLGAASGVSMMTGLALLYRGYSIAKMGAVAPSSSVVLSAVPVAWDALQGRFPAALGVVGIVLGIVGVAIATWESSGKGSTRTGLMLGAASGVFFGVAFTLMSETSKSAGLSPPAAQRVTGFVLLLMVALRHRAPVLATRQPERHWALFGGVAGCFAIASLQLGFQRGDAGPVAVASSQFATVAVVLAAAFSKERLRGVQWLGVLLAGIGVALLAVSG